MNNHIRNLCQTCTQCQALSPVKKRDPANRAQAKAAEDLFPMSDVALDLFTVKNTDYLVQVDRFSGFPFVHRLTKTTTKSIIDHLMKWLSLEGIPQRCRTDGGPQFRGPFQDFCANLGIKHELSLAFNPESNGLAENAVKQTNHLLIKVPRRWYCLRGSSTYMAKYTESQRTKSSRAIPTPGTQTPRNPAIPRRSSLQGDRGNARIPSTTSKAI